jgi:hypothetical protein
MQKDLDLTDDFKFGYRVYQCQIPWPGIAYRNSPVFADKNERLTGPLTGEVIIADAIVQGPHCIYLRCVSGNGWLPMSDPTGNTMCFKHLGPLNKIQFNRYDLCKTATPAPNALKAIMADAHTAASPGSLSSMELNDEFKFGMRVYQCAITDPGVAYRNTPLFSDKSDIEGPKAPECIVGDAVIQGPNSVFVRCTSGKGWLPLTDASGSRQFMLFKHLGEVDDVDLDDLKIAR